MGGFHTQPGCGEPSSLIERLRAPLWEHSAAMFCGPRLSQEETLADLNAAADRIEALEAFIIKLAREEGALRSALEPFVKHYEEWMERLPDGAEMSIFPRHKMGDVRAARRALVPSLEQSGSGK